MSGNSKGKQGNNYEVRNVRWKGAAMCRSGGTRIQTRVLVVKSLDGIDADLPWEGVVKGIEVEK
jgi:hypothetical protein